VTVWGTRGVGGPHDGAGLQVEGNDAAAVVGSRLGVVVSGANLEHLPLLINGRRTPHAAPAAPTSCVSMLFLRVGFGSLEIMNVFQTGSPVFAFRDTTLPRNEQHSYSRLADNHSSREATPKYKCPL